MKIQLEIVLQSGKPQNQEKEQKITTQQPIDRRKLRSLFIHSKDAGIVDSTLK